MELKHGLPRPHHHAQDAFNRTTMELKLHFLHEPNRSDHAFNRTTMELKHSARNKNCLSRHLLIEPLWNWNQPLETRAWRLRLLLIEPLWNWNKICSRHDCLLLIAFNRTTMELKPRFKAAIARQCFAFNRTTMELKLGIFNPLALIRAILLIEPLWNWNVINLVRFAALIDF